MVLNETVDVVLDTIGGLEVVVDVDILVVLLVMDGGGAFVGVTCGPTVELSAYFFTLTFLLISTVLGDELAFVDWSATFLL